MPCFGEGTLANLLLRHKELVTGWLIPILRLVSHQRLVPLLDIWSDIDHEARTTVGIEAGIKNLEWPVRRRSGIQLRQSGEKARFVSNDRCGVVVRMTARPIWQDDNAGSHFAQHTDNLHP